MDIARRHQRLVDIKANTLALQETIIKERYRVRTLKVALRQRRDSIEEVKAKQVEHITNERERGTKLYMDIRKRLSLSEERSTGVNIVKARRVLVKALMDVYDIHYIEKSNSVTGGEPIDKAETRDYLVHGLVLPSHGDLTILPRERTNAVFGYIAHLIQLLALYLAIHLPFQIIFLGSSSYIRIHYTQSDTITNLPLYMTDDNYDLFIFAVTALNYNVLYMCHMQGVNVGPSRICMTLANIVSCYRAPDLGKYSTFSMAPQRHALNQTFSHLDYFLGDNTTLPHHSSLFPYTFSRIFHTVQRRYHHETDSGFGVIEKQHILSRSLHQQSPLLIQKQRPSSFTVNPQRLAQLQQMSKQERSKEKEKYRPLHENMTTVFTVVYPFDMDSDDEDGQVDSNMTDDDDNNAYFNRRARLNRLDRHENDFNGKDLDNGGHSMYSSGGATDSFEDLDVSEIQSNNEQRTGLNSLHSTTSTVSSSSLLSPRLSEHGNTHTRQSSDQSVGTVARDQNSSTVRRRHLSAETLMKPITDEVQYDADEDDWDELAPSVVASVMFNHSKRRKPSALSQPNLSHTSQSRQTSKNNQNKFNTTANTSNSSVNRVGETLSDSIGAVFRSSPSALLLSSSAAVVGSTVESVMSWSKGFFRGPQ